MDDAVVRGAAIAEAAETDSSDMMVVPDTEPQIGKMLDVHKVLKVGDSLCHRTGLLCDVNESVACCSPARSRFDVPHVWQRHGAAPPAPPTGTPGLVSTSSMSTSIGTGVVEDRSLSRSSTSPRRIRWQVRDTAKLAALVHIILVWETA